MFSALRPVALLTAVVGLFFAVAILAWMRADVSRSPSRGQSDSTTAEIDARSPATLAARYHLRTRTQRFFDRAKGSSSKPRPPGGLLTPRKRGRHADAAAVDDRWLAGRYHQRQRTSRFFKRRVG